MRKSSFSLTFVAALLLSAASLLTSCKRDYHEDPDYKNYTTYVSSVRDSSDRYYDRDWAELERDYNDRKVKADKAAADMDEKAKAEYEQMDRDWNEFKTRYEARRAEAAADAERNNRMSTMRSALLIDPNDNTFSTVNAAGVLPAYQKFYDAVKANKDSYSEQDWSEVNVIYNAMKARRQAVENEIPKKDKMEIQNIELGYEAMQTVNKPFAPEADDKKAQ
jgi:hypothetical protein